MKATWKRTIVSVLAIATLAATSAYAQLTTGSVSGTVVDQTGAVIPGAAVTLINEATGVTRETETNDFGFFNFDRVRVGLYTVRISISGFRTYETRELEVAVGKVSSLGQVPLEVGATAEVVTVEAGAVPLVQADSPQVVGVYDARTVADVNWGIFGLDAVAFLTPGVVPGFGNINTNTGGFSDATGSDGVPAAGGMRGRSTQFSMDGHEINDITLGGPNLFLENLDTVAEYQITVNQFDASQGRLPGAQVNVITKSGGNDLHGSAFWFYDANSLRAKTRSEARFDQEKPKEIDQKFGGTVGGPIIQNKWFGFGSYWRNKIPATTRVIRERSVAFTPPGAAMLAAAFPGNTAVANYAAVGPFTQSIGDPQCNPGTEVTLDFTPFGGPAGVPACGIVRSLPDNQFFWEYSLRMDVVTDTAGSFSGRWFQEKDTFDWAATGSGGDSASGYIVAGIFPGQSLSFTHAYEFTPRALNEFRFSYGRLSATFGGGPTAGLGAIRDNIAGFRMFDLDGVGCVGANCASDGTAAGLDVMNYGLGSNLPQGRLVYNFQWQDNFSYIWGRHTIKAGMEVRRNRTTAPFLPFVNGAFSYADPTQWFTNAGNVRFTEGPIAFQPFETDQFYYVQDDIRLRSNFILNVGLRYENTGQPVNAIREEQLARETGPGAFWLQSLPLEDRVYRPTARDDNNWGPRIGFAYNPRWGQWLFGEDKTVIRGGYMIAYEAAFYNILLNITTSAPRVFGFTVLGFPVPGGGTGTEVATSIPTPRNAFDPRENFQTKVQQNFSSPYAQIWQLGIQREFMNTMVLELRYMGNRNIGQYQSVNANPLFFAGFPGAPTGVTPCSAGSAPSTFQNPDASQGRIFCNEVLVRERRNSARSNYHSLQTRFDFRNVADQITGGIGFTWSKMIDNVSEIFFFDAQGSPAFSQNPFDYLGAERGNSNQNTPLTFTAHWIWDVPMYRDQQGALGKLLGGWELSGQGFLYHGFPWTPSHLFPTGNGSCDLDQAWNLTFIGAFTTCRPYFGNPNAPIDSVGSVGDPTARWWENDGSMGPFGISRNPGGTYGDNTVLFNSTFIKNTRFGPENRFNLQFRAMVRNIFNHRNNGTPGEIFTEFGDFGRYRDNVTGRRVSLGLRLVW